MFAFMSTMGLYDMLNLFGLYGAYQIYGIDLGQ